MFRDNRSVGVLVLGMHRSGTSALTATCGILGAELGGHLLGPKEDNKKGFFEDGRMVGINMRLLKRLNFDGPLRALPLPANWSETQNVADAYDEIVGLLASDFAPHPVFALKDPRACITAPLWIKAMNNLRVRVKCIVTARHPQEVVRSLHARDRVSMRMGYALWLRHTVDAVQASNGYPRMFVNYDRLFEDVGGFADDFVRFVGRKETVFRSEERDKAIADFLDLGLRNQSAKNYRREGYPLEDLSVALYHAIQSGSEDAVVAAMNDEWMQVYRMFCDDQAEVLARIINKVKKGAIGRGEG